MFMSLINLDADTLISILVWGSFATSVIVYLYQRFTPCKMDFNVLRNMAIIRFLTCIGYFLLLLRGEIPDILSANTGNTLLFFCYFLEARVLLEVTGLTSKKHARIGIVILSVSILVFNIFEFLYRAPALRIFIASIIIFALWLQPTIALIGSKNKNPFKKGVSVFYVFLLCALVIRSVSYFFDKTLSLHTNNYYQTLLFVSLSLLNFVNIVIYLLFMKEQSDMVIEKMARYDNLTETLNRYSFFEWGKHSFENHIRSGAGLALLFFDLDHFKITNDTYGHLFGDRVLEAFADILKNNTHSKDFCCRYGGEEFIVLLTNTNSTDGKAVAARIRQEFEKYRVPEHPEFHTTVSAGFIWLTPKNGDTLEQCIKKADEALYHAKKNGRNQIIDYDLELPV